MTNYPEEDLLVLKRHVLHLTGCRLTQNDLAIELDALKARYGKGAGPVSDLPERTGTSDFETTESGQRFLWAPWMPGPVHIYRAYCPAPR